jgi:hypothetical protein
MLCEYCGYILTGLPEGSRCPECGKPAADSTAADSRRLPEWEKQPSFGSWVRTRNAVWLHPSRFARRMITRTDDTRSRWFARISWAMAAIWFWLAAAMHLKWVEARPIVAPQLPGWIYLGYALGALFMPVWIYLLLALTHRMAVTLTVWEAGYRGLRLPRTAVTRGMHYHAAHYEPVALAAAILVLGFQFALRHHLLGLSGDLIYIGSLSGFVIVAAGYLFFTYWAIMRNLLYANY